jgi:biotin operon repressor
MIEVLKGKYGHLPNYRIIEKAVSNYDGKATFYISGNADWGCSSLCEFQASETLKQTWPGRKDFSVTDKVDVEVIRLETFIDQLKKEGVQIDEIQYFHCDVQGQDLEALMGMGKYLSLIRSGVIEMPTSHQVKLYANQKFLDADAIQFLEKNGFKITRVQSNDRQCNEVNIYFERSQ